MENHPGMGGALGAELVATSLADGYALLVNSSSHAYTGAFSTGLSHDPLRNFVAVALIVSQPLVLVAGQLSGVKTLRGLIAVARKKQNVS